MRNRNEKIRSTPIRFLSRFETVERAIIVLLVAAGLDAQITPARVRDIAQRAYIYAYPLVLIEETRGATPVNRFTHIPRFPRPDYRQIVRPNADTLYSTAWLDLSREPILIYIPDSKGRFYLLQFMDAWTETFADPGKRTTGTAEKWFAVVGPDWTGKLPDHVVRLDAPTNIVWLLGRTQTNGASDYDNVHAFQHGMRMMALSEYPNGVEKTGPAQGSGAAASNGTPPERVKAMDARTFFAAFATAMKANRPHAEDAPMVRDLAEIGLVPGRDFDPSNLAADQLRALGEGIDDASVRIEGLVTSASTKPGWTAFNRTVGRYGADYMGRAATARLGLGANPPEDAIYINSTADGSGQMLNGSRRYRMHFENSNLPPVRAFWSITAYNQGGYFIGNPLDRYAIGNRDALRFNADGSLDLYIQSQNPGPDHDSNWLPSGNGPFNLTFRLYWPEDAILNGSWRPPSLERLP